MSRIHGGIPFPFDNRDGLTLGRPVTDFVLGNALAPVPAHVLAAGPGADARAVPRGARPAWS